MAAMFEIFAKTFVDGLEAYVAIGIVFALPFVCLGVQHVDNEARGSGVGFRLLILPGVVACWPMFLYRWTRGVVEPPIERNRHRDTAT